MTVSKCYLIDHNIDFSNCKEALKKRNLYSCDVVLFSNLKLDSLYKVVQI